MNKKHTFHFVIVLFIVTMVTVMAPQKTLAEGIYDGITIDGREYKPEIREDKYTYMLPYEADVSEIYDEESKPEDLTIMKGSEAVAALWVNMSETDCELMHGDKGRKISVTADIFNVSDDSQQILAASAEIKGRGNVSWTRAKKSYQIKFDEKQDVLGMGSAKRWILIPASYDLSMVRNAVAFELAERLGMEYACDYKYVDLYLGGRYYGVYILCEKIELKKNRVDIESVDDNIEKVLGKDVMLSDVDVRFENDDYSTAIVGDVRIDLTGGYHLEFDNYYEDIYQFKTQKNCRVTIDSPEMISDGKDVKTNDAYRYIIDFVQKAENAVYSNDEEELLKYIDIESFAKMWIMKDYLGEADATNNMHFWKESSVTGDGLIHAGPAWDYDCSMDRDSTSASTAIYQYVNMESDGSAKWLGDLLHHQVFRDELLKQYYIFEYLFTTETVNGEKTCSMRDFAIQEMASYTDSSKMDTARWTGTEDFCKIGPDFDDADRAVSGNVVKSFLIKRNEYFAERMGEIKEMVTVPYPEPTPDPNATPVPTTAPTSSPTEVPTVAPTKLPTQTPVVIPTPVPANNVTATPAPAKVPKRGDKIKDKKGTAIYLVKTVKKGKIEVNLYKLLNKKVKRYKVPKTVVLANGRKAKITEISSGAFKKCKKLRRVIVGKNIKKIGKGARKFLKKHKN